MKRWLTLLLFLPTILLAREPRQIWLDILTEQRSLEERLGIEVTHLYYPCDEVALEKYRQQSRTLKELWPYLPAPLTEEIRRISFLHIGNGRDFDSGEPVNAQNTFNEMAGGRSDDHPVYFSERPGVPAIWMYPDPAAEFIPPGYHRLQYSEGELALFVDGESLSGYQGRLLGFRDGTLYIAPLCASWNDGGYFGYYSHLDHTAFPEDTLIEFILYVYAANHSAEMDHYLWLTERHGLRSTESDPLPFPSQEERIQRLGFWVLRFHRQLQHWLSEIPPSNSRMDRYRAFLQEYFYANFLDHMDQLSEEGLAAKHQEFIQQLQEAMEEAHLWQRDCLRIINDPQASLRMAEERVPQILECTERVRRKAQEGMAWGMEEEAVAPYLERIHTIEIELVAAVQQRRDEYLVPSSERGEEPITLQFCGELPEIHQGTPEQIEELRAYLSECFAPVEAQDQSLETFGAIHSLKDAFVRSRLFLATQWARENPIQSITISEGVVTFHLSNTHSEGEQTLSVRGGLTIYNDPVPYADTDSLEAILRHIARRRR